MAEKQNKLDAKLQKRVDAIRATLPKLEDFRAANEEQRKEMLKDLPLASLIDMAYQQREERKALDKEIKAMNALYEEMEFGIVQRMEEQSDEDNPLTSAGGLLASAFVIEEDVQSVDPNMWPTLYEWIADNRSAYILQKRLSSGAVQELLNAGEELPGVTTLTRKKLNLRAR